MKRLGLLCIAWAFCTSAIAQPAQQQQQVDPDPGAAANEITGTRDADKSRKMEVVWEAPDALSALFKEHLPAPVADTGERRRASLRPWIRDTRQKVTQIAAAEGWFSPTVDIETDEARPDRVVVRVTPGPRTTVGTVEIAFEGDIAGEGPERARRRDELREAFAMKTGQPMRSADWDVAKTRIQESLSERDYAAATLVRSEARVDAEAARAALTVVLDSGPPFTFGDVRIAGLKEYSEAVVRRSVDIDPGERFSQERLTELQRRIQNGPWFSSVVVDVPRERSAAQRVPVNITVSERPRTEIGLALGYGTDDGPHAEVAYRYRDLFDRGFDLQSSLRVAQKRQIGYADVYLPPGLHRLGRRTEVPYQDSVGVLVEHSDIENLELSRFAVAGYRHFRLEDFEVRAGLSYQIENSKPQGAEERIKRALAPIVAVTWRNVDNVFDPRRGGVLSLQMAAGQKSLASGDDFFKVYGQYQHWFRVGRSNQLILRTEMGRTFTGGPERIPEDFLYRAGGSRSNRGYAFQSLGVQEGDAIVGGRYLLTGTAELVHWLNDKWGAAVFTDVGDASDSRSDWDANPSYGIGARFRTPAGPFALDLAYAQDPRNFRLAFSVNIAF